MTCRHAGAVAALSVFVITCGPAVSDHDNRIYAAAASVKLSAADLSAAYHGDAGAADGRYRGRVVEISGVIRQIQAEGAKVVLAGGEGGPDLEMSFHEDVAGALVKTMAEGQRITLKCFCEGLDQHVRLRSCVTPDPGR